MFTLIDTLNTEAQTLESSDLEQAYTLATQAFQQAQAMGYGRGMAAALVTMASVNEHRAAYRQSIQQALEAVARAEALQENLIISSAYSILGWNYYALGDYPMGMLWAIKQLQHAEAIEYLQGQAEAHNLIGSLQGELDDDNILTLHHYQQSLALYRQLGRLDKEAVLLNNLCITYDYLKRYDEALLCGEQALESSLRVKSLYSEVLVLGNLAIVYSKIGLYAQALDFYTRRLQICVAQGYRTLEVHTLLNIGRLHRRSGLYALALQYIKQALTHAATHEYRKWVSDCHHELSALYENLGDFQQALHHHQAFHAAEHEIVNEESLAQAERLRVVYDLEKVQEELQRERQQREQDRAYYTHMSALKDHIINTASHDLKSPLSSIFISLDMLQKMLNGVEPRIGGLIMRAQHSARLMHDMIHQLLDKAILESGRGLMPTTFALQPFIENIVQDMRILAINKQITLALPEIPIMVRLDADRMRQALSNLLSNAVKYTGEYGMIHVSARVDEEMLMLSVRDNGIGIPPNALPRLFEPFFRVHPQQAVEGTGLGLSIVKTIIDQHNGTIGIESTEGIGTTFEIMLPQAIVHELLV